MIRLGKISLQTFSKSSKSLRVKWKPRWFIRADINYDPVCNYGYMNEIMGGHKRSDYPLPIPAITVKSGDRPKRRKTTHTMLQKRHPGNVQMDGRLVAF